MHGKQEIIIIAAMSENCVIGKDNALPWSIKEDLIHFKDLTKGWPCVMGRKTWESLPKRPLPQRLNVIVSRTLKEDDLISGGASGGGMINNNSGTTNNNSGTLSTGNPTEVKICASLNAAIEQCAAYQKVFVCGGASIYREAIPLADTMELTLIHRNYEGDTFFPQIDPALWIKTASVDFDNFSWVSYSKKR